MKKTQLLFALLLSFNTALISQTDAAYYTINIGTFLEAKLSDFSSLKSLGFLHATKLEDNLNQVYLGGYKSLNGAKGVLAKVRQAGYTNAFIQEDYPGAGTQVSVIQIASMRTNTSINWRRYGKAGNLYALLDGNLIKLCVGMFPNTTAARKQLKGIQQKGFRDAFIKNVNSIYVHGIDAFESGGIIKKPLIPIDFDEKGQIQAKSPNQRPDDFDIRPGAKNIPPTNSGKKSTSEIKKSVSKTAALPNIRGKIKRRSSLELQKTLKDQGWYGASLDGYYGPGTKSAFEAYKAGDPSFKKYNILAQYLESSEASQGGDRLQTAINNLLDRPAGVEGFPHYISKIYQAYILFDNLGPNNSTNNLMNSAIQEAFGNLPVGLSAGFDHLSSYAYNNLYQLLSHMVKIHGAQENYYTIPCWLPERHTEEFGRINTDYSALAGLQKSQSCTGFNNWDEIKILQVIAEDFIINTKGSRDQIKKGQAVSAGLYTISGALSTELSRELELWNNNLWQNANTWAKQDPLHQKLINALKVSYYQAQVRMEDYYMDKGFKADQSKDLALAALRALVGYQLQRFN